jgi:hypothetical protein
VSTRKRLEAYRDHLKRDRLECAIELADFHETYPDGEDQSEIVGLLSATQLTILALDAVIDELPRDFDPETLIG